MTNTIVRGFRSALVSLGLMALISGCATMKDDGMTYDDRARYELISKGQGDTYRRLEDYKRGREVFRNSSREVVEPYLIPVTKFPINKKN